MFNNVWKGSTQLVARCVFENGKVKFESFSKYYKDEENTQPLCD